MQKLLSPPWWSRPQALGEESALWSLRTCELQVTQRHRGGPSSV